MLNLSLAHIPCGPDSVGHNVKVADTLSSCNLCFSK